MFPNVLILIPIYLIWSKLHLVNTLSSLIFTYSTFILPFSVWMLRSYFQGIPQDLEEAAMVDGCTRLQAILRVILPAAAPGLVAVGLYSFVLCWQEFLFASVLIRDNRIATITPAIYMFVGHQRTEWGPLAAQCLMAVIPVAVLFVYLQKFLVSGLTAGAVKG
jgi:ABC-type glycerol-3-phosphate transport system permease component